jgi:hypothetical protein
MMTDTEKRNTAVAVGSIAALTVGAVALTIWGIRSMVSDFEETASSVADAVTGLFGGDDEGGEPDA